MTNVNSLNFITAINIKEKNPEIIGVCTSGTGGVKSATYSLTSNVIEIPGIKSSGQADIAANEIIKYNPKKVVISGYPPRYDLLARSIKKKRPSIRIFFISHAPFTWYHGRAKELLGFRRMFDAYNDGCIEKMGFVKRDVAAYFKERGVNAFLIMNRPPKFNSFKHKLGKGKLKVGVWGNDRDDMWHRNLLNQVVSGLMIKNSEVHVNGLPDYFFLDENRINRHGILPKEKYVPLLRSMDINLYVSFTDAFPMTVIESMSYGIPCIVSDTSEVYDGNRYLKKMLTESKIDSPLAMKNRIELVVKNYDKIKKEIASHIPVLEKKIEKTIVEFLK